MRKKTTCVTITTVLFGIQETFVFFFFSLIFLFLLAIPHDMWDLRSPTRDQTHTPCTGVLLPLHHQGSPQKSLVFIMERHVWALLLGRGAR